MDEELELLTVDGSKVNVRLSQAVAAAGRKIQHDAYCIDLQDGSTVEVRVLKSGVLTPSEARDQSARYVAEEVETLNMFLRSGQRQMTVARPLSGAIAKEVRAAGWVVDIRECLVPHEEHVTLHISEPESAAVAS